MAWNFFKRSNNEPPAEERQSVEAVSFKPVTALPSSEELCEIDPNKMTSEEIRSHLKILYKRHNEAAASLNEDLRKEAETMLDAIVECRGKYVDNA